MRPVSSGSTVFSGRRKDDPAGPLPRVRFRIVDRDPRQGVSFFREDTFQAEQPPAVHHLGQFDRVHREKGTVQADIPEGQGRSQVGFRNAPAPDGEELP